MKYSTTIFLLLILWSACSNKKINTTVEAHHEVYVIQGDNQELIKDNDIVDLRKGEFGIRFYNKKYNPDDGKYYAAMVAFSFDKNEFSNYKIGDSLNEIPYFKSGTGMATSGDGTAEPILVRKGAHNHLFYKNESERRVNLVKDLGNDFLELEYEVKGFYSKDNPDGIEKSDLESISVAILIDRNLNEMIDKDELHRFTINFEN